jgi:hypothetical protein
MSKKAFADMMRDEGSGAEPQTPKENLLNAREVFGEIWDAAKPMFDHGRSELAAAIFAGHAHVMYMHNDKDQEQPQHGLPSEPQKEVEQEREM